MRYHPERFILTIASEHEVAHNKVDSLSVTYIGKVQGHSTETALQAFDAFISLKECFLGEGTVKVLSDLVKATV